jgi:hypothetical protein
MERERGFDHLLKFEARSGTPHWQLNEVSSQSSAVVRERQFHLGKGRLMSFGPTGLASLRSSAMWRVLSVAIGAGIADTSRPVCRSDCPAFRRAFFGALKVKPKPP